MIISTGMASLAEIEVAVNTARKSGCSEIILLHCISSYPAPNDSYSSFVSSFKFEETPDQLKTMDDVLLDMQSDRPMDRLVCGDVGFGKTEVAMRAAFIAVSGSPVLRSASSRLPARFLESLNPPGKKLSRRKSDMIRRAI